MKTFKILISLSFLLTVAMAQGLSLPNLFKGSEPDTVAQEPEETVVVDTTATVEEMPDSVTSLDPEEVQATLDSIATELASETEAAIEAAEAAFDSLDTMLQPDIHVAGLIKDQSILRWGNEEIEDKGLTDIEGVSLASVDALILKSADCIDIVCYLLATADAGLEYIILSLEEGTQFQIYDAKTKVVMVETDTEGLVQSLTDLIYGPPEVADSALVDSAFTALADSVPPSVASDDYLIDLGLYLPDFMHDPAQKEKKTKIRTRYFRDMRLLNQNPSNLARNYERFTSWNLLPDVAYNFHNSQLTPGWFTQWLTEGGVWSDAEKADFMSTLAEQNVEFRSHLALPSIIGIRIGPVGFNTSLVNWVNVTPGKLVTLPWQDIKFDQTVDLGGLEVETVPAIVKAGLSYGQVIPTPIGDLRAGVGINMLTAGGYVKVQADTFTIETTFDSTFVRASGTGWYTLAGADGNLTDPNTDGLEPTKLISDAAVSLDLGVGLNLQPLINQELDLSLGLRNLGAQFNWSGIRHESWYYELDAPGLVELADIDGDSLEEAGLARYGTEIIDTEGTLTIDMPLVVSMTAVYQPVSMLFLRWNFEKALTDEAVIHVASEAQSRFQVSFFPWPALDFTFQRGKMFDVPVYTLGTGLHFGIWDGRIAFNFHNGFNTEAKGIGFNLSSSWHF